MTPFDLDQHIRANRYISSARVMFIPLANAYAIFSPGTLTSPRETYKVVENPAEVLDFIQKEGHVVRQTPLATPARKSRLSLEDLGL